MALWAATARRTSGRPIWIGSRPATIVLPATDLDQIEEGRTTLGPARRAEGVRDARMAGNTAAFTVGSGAYRFVRWARAK